MRRLIPVACLAAALAGGPGPASAGPGSPPALDPDARERFVGALDAFKAGNWGSAARGFGAAAWARTPLAEYALLFSAGSLARLGDMAGARVAVAAAVDGAAEPGLPPSALLQAAAILAEAGDQPGAVGLYRRFLDRAPEHAEAGRARWEVALGLLDAGKREAAARAFLEIWLLLPGSSYATSAEQRLGALERDGGPRPVPTQRQRLERAERLLATGMADAARTEAEALLAQKPGLDLALRALRAVLEAARRVRRDEVAAATVKRALGLAPVERRPPWLLELARLQRGRLAAAVGTIDRILREHPQSREAAEALLMKAQLLEAAGRAPEAEAAYLGCAARFPEAEEAGAALWRLGWLAWFRRAPAAAAGHWERVLKIRGGQAHRERALYWAGRAREALGDMEAAGRHWALVAQEGPRGYYGILAQRRLGHPVGVRAAATPVALPADPLDPLETDARWVKVAALRAVGLRDFVEEELEDMTRRALGDARRLYALSAAWAQDSRYHQALRILRRHFLPVARGGWTGMPQTFWELFYPLGWRAELLGAAARTALDPWLVAAVVREESSFHPQARSRAGARGLMQLMPETGRALAQARRLPFRDGELLDDPAANLEMGSAFLAGLVKEFGDPRLATAAYNAGPGRVREWWGARESDDIEVWVEQIPFTETRNFVKRVAVSWEEYRRIYGAGD